MSSRTDIPPRVIPFRISLSFRIVSATSSFRREEGGTIIATGTPEQIARNPESLTGQFLKDKVH